MSDNGRTAVDDRTSWPTRPSKVHGFISVTMAQVIIVLLHGRL